MDFYEEPYKCNPGWSQEALVRCCPRTLSTEVLLLLTGGGMRRSGNGCCGLDPVDVALWKTQLDAIFSRHFRAVHAIFEFGHFREDGAVSHSLKWIVPAISRTKERLDGRAKE